jgi:hypothetical protein
MEGEAMAMTAAPARRAWLDVPFADKDRAKALGARWDPAARSWYAPRLGMPGFSHWERLPELLPDEDRSFGDGLFVDLIPETSWFTNVRSAVEPRDWERLRQMVYRRAGYRCEACGAAEDRQRGVRMEAHERFTYDAPAGVQRLARLICLCGWCHTATHMGFAGVRGVQDEATAHLMAVTGMNPTEASQHIDEAFTRWERRSAIRWRVDLSMIAAAGIRLAQTDSICDGDIADNTVTNPVEPVGVLVVSATFIPASELPPAREPGLAERALAASYERYADELAAIEALRSGRQLPPAGK